MRNISIYKKKPKERNFEAGPFPFGTVVCSCCVNFVPIPLDVNNIYHCFLSAIFSRHTKDVGAFTKKLYNEFVAEEIKKNENFDINNDFEGVMDGMFDAFCEEYNCQDLKNYVTSGRSMFKKEKQLNKAAIMAEGAGLDITPLSSAVSGRVVGYIDRSYKSDWMYTLERMRKVREIVEKCLPSGMIKDTEYDHAIRFCEAMYDYPNTKKYLKKFFYTSDVGDLTKSGLFMLTPYFQYSGKPFKSMDSFVVGKFVYQMHTSRTEMFLEKV
jgi:hypothetical protein